ncbi:MAG: hypothetical protein U1A07_14205 [Phenylobacterium sp.]|nr:hypothetical protein [Brevundimonas sp.]MDZ4319972.1 hypothetical protein [Phenylobacterium sp.]
MTTDLLDELDTLTPQLSGAVETVRLDEAAKKALDQLKTAKSQAERFSAAVNIVRLLERQSDPAIRTALRDARNKARDVGEALQEATDADGVQDAALAFGDGFAAAVGALDGAVREAWSRAVFGEFDTLRVMGQLLEKIDDTRPLGEALLATGQRAQQLTIVRPPLQELSAHIETLQAEAFTLKERLRQVGDEDPDVDAFLRAATVSQATARHLTASVRTWLEKNHALDVFAVRAG